MSETDLSLSVRQPEAEVSVLDRSALPTMFDLPSEYPEEPGLPDEFHDIQPQLLSRTLRLTDYSRQNYFTASDLNIYYDVEHPQWHKRSDWFLAVGVPRMYEGHMLRSSYVTWQEEAAPYVVVEFLSAGTTRDDLGRFYEPGGLKKADLGRDKPPGKLTVYEQYLRVPHYIVYSHHSQRLRYFRLVDGCYEEQRLETGNCRIWLADLKIGLGLWEGEFEEAYGHWLRWCDREGEWYLTDTERAQRAEEQERLAKEQERLAKEQAQVQLLAAAQNLLATGMDLAAVVELLGLSAEQRQQLE